MSERQELAVVSDRDRIARDLHDVVIQRLFATGLQLQGTRRRVESPLVAERLDQAVADLDETIRDIRTTIFGLRQSTGRAACSRKFGCSRTSTPRPSVSSHSSAATDRWTP